MNPDRRQIRELGEMAGRVGMVLVGRCRDCRWWRESIGGTCVVGEEAARLTAPNFGCVMWEAKEEENASE